MKRIFPCLIALAHAQETLPPLEVTGDRLSDQKESESIITSDAIRAHRFTSRDDLLAMSGGYVGAPLSGNFSLRGLNNDNLLNSIGTESNSLISVLTDRVPQSTSTRLFFPRLLWDLDQASILKGGQIASYGPSALGGAVIYQDARPTFDWSGRFRTEIGERGLFHSGFTQNIPLSEKVALRFHHEYLQSDGSVLDTLTNNDRWAEMERHFVKSQLLWKLAEETSLHLIVEHDRSQSNPFVAISGRLEDRQTAEDIQSRYPSTHWLVSLGLEHEFASGTELQSTFGFSSLSIDGISDFDGSALFAWDLFTRIEETHFTHGLSLSGSWDEHLWTLGTYTQLSDYTLGFQGSDLLGAGIPFSTTGKERAVIASVFGELDYALTNTWHLTGGMRINYESRKTNANVNIPPLLTRRSSERDDFLDALPSLALEWRGNSQWNAGIKLSRSYRSGGVSYAPGLGIVQSYDPEYSNDAVIYARYHNSDTFQISGSLFYGDYEDGQVPVLVPGGLAGIDELIANIGDGQRYGAEVALTWKPITHVLIDFNVTYVHTEFDQLLLNGTNRSGQGFPNAPDLVTSLGVAYQPEQGIFGALRMSWADDSYSDVESPVLTHLGSRLDLNGKIGYRAEHWEVYLFGTNLLDHSYALAKDDSTNIGVGVRATVNDPRTFGIGFQVEW